MTRDYMNFFLARAGGDIYRAYCEACREIDAIRYHEASRAYTRFGFFSGGSGKVPTRQTSVDEDEEWLKTGVVNE